MQQDKRQLILAAAADTFAAHGFHQATIEQIAEAAGVGKGTVYLYFKSKKGLFDALLLESLQRILQQIKAVVEAPVDPIERIRRLIHLHLQILQRNHPMMQMITREFSPGKLESLRPELSQYMNDLLELYTLLLEEGIANGYLRQHNPQVIALAFLGAVNQVGSNLIHGRLLIDLAESETGLFQLFVGGLQKQDEQAKAPAQQSACKQHNDGHY